MVKFGYTILYVGDVHASIDFYEKAFGFTKKFITPENDYGELITGETTLAFADFALASSNLSQGFTPANVNDKPFGIELGFISDHVQLTINHAIAAGATLVEDVIQKPWGQSAGYIRDINGFLIEICSPM